MKRAIFLLFLMFNVVSFASNPRVKLIEAIDVLDRFMAIPEESIPKKLLADAKAVAIIPDVIKAGFVVGGRYGVGVLLIKDKHSRWQGPYFIELKGGSLGWQIGVQSIDIILVFKSKESVRKLLDQKITLGADASIAVGPVGRSALAATDIKLDYEIFSYSRSKGFFAGVSLTGAVIEMSNDLKINTDNPLAKELKKRLFEYSNW